MRKRKQESSGTGVLVVVELGSEWPGLMQADASSRRVLTQHEGETPAAFSERVAGSLDALFGRGVMLSTVALACNERLDDAANEARRRLGGLSLGAMARHKSGRFVFTAPTRSGGRLRHALTSLSRALDDEWRSAGLSVTVELGEPVSAPATADEPTGRARVA